MLVERHNFYQIRGNAGEFVERLERATRNCEFHDQTLDMVRDKLVLTYPDQTVKQRMLGKADVSLDNMLNLHSCLKSIQSNCQIIDNSCDINHIFDPTPVMKIEKDKHQETSKCGNYGLSHECLPSKGKSVEKESL